MYSYLNTLRVCGCDSYERSLKLSDLFHSELGLLTITACVVNSDVFLAAQPWE